MFFFFQSFNTSGDSSPKKLYLNPFPHPHNCDWLSGKLTDFLPFCYSYNRWWLQRQPACVDCTVVFIRVKQPYTYKAFPLISLKVNLKPYLLKNQILFVAIISFFFSFYYYYCYKYYFTTAVFLFMCVHSSFTH